MKRILSTIVLVLFTLATVAQTAQTATSAAKEANPNASKKERKALKQKTKQIEADPFTKGTGTVYMFAVGQYLTDEDVYFTSVCEVNEIDLEKKTKFLPFRYDFSIQFKEYLEGKLGLSKQTVSVFFSDKKATLNKKYVKVKKRYTDNPDRKVHVVSVSDFKFKHPLDAQ